MLATSLNQSYKEIKKQVRKKGVLGFLSFTVDKEKMLHGIANVFADILSKKLGFSKDAKSSATKAIVTRLTDEGLPKLAKIAKVLSSVYSKIGDVKKLKAATKPKLANPEQIAAKFVGEFGKSGLTVSADEKYSMAKELRKDAETLKRLGDVSTQAEGFEKCITKLSMAAKNELFRPFPKLGMPFKKQMMWYLIKKGVSK